MSNQASGAAIPLPNDELPTTSSSLVPPSSSYQRNVSNSSNNNNSSNHNINDNNMNNSNASSDGPTSITLSLAEVLYSAASYHAIAKPVSLTMMLSSLAVIFINTPQTISQGEAEMAQYYYAFHSSSDNPSTGQNLAYSVANSLVIVGWIGAMTFVIVLLYKFRCMKCLIGYMIFSSGMLLGLLGGRMFYVAIEKYRVGIDVLSYYFLLYNFAMVGTISIFYQRGIPTWITQGYLIMTSVILAWQFSHFDAFMTWTLLVMLALYDLCAVLTPCGPLKALVGLMQQDDSPEMPGLLYEAELPPEAERPGRRTNRNNSRREGGESEGAAPVPNPAPNTDTVLSPPTPINPPMNPPVSLPVNPSMNPPINLEMTTATTPSTERTALLPLAIAKIYHLPILPHTPPPDAAAPPTTNSSNVSTSPLLDDTVPAPATQSRPTPAELRANVRVLLPANGGRIETVTTADGRQPRYVVTDRHGTQKRVLIVDRQGRVFEEVDEDDDEEGGQLSNSIKLGLGDFIFYSVLVSKAASYSFTTFAACMLVILAGLGMTLVLLSVYHQALPALPISIFLGVLFYLLTRMVIEPYIEDILKVPYYV